MEPSIESRTSHLARVPIPNGDRDVGSFADETLVCDGSAPTVMTQISQSQVAEIGVCRPLGLHVDASSVIFGGPARAAEQPA